MCVYIVFPRVKHFTYHCIVKVWRRLSTGEEGLCADLLTRKSGHCRRTGAPRIKRTVPLGSSHWEKRCRDATTSKENVCVKSLFGVTGLDR